MSRIIKSCFILSAVIGSSYALNEGDKPWSHAQIRLVEDSALDQDFHDWLTTQPQIKLTYDEGATNPKLEMFREDSDVPGETLFAAAVPLGMVKNILKEKNLLNMPSEEL